MRAKHKNGRPEWSRKIEDFRHQLEISQSAFGSQLQTSAMAVSRWERGMSEPPADVYIRLGNLAEDPLCWFFWGRAGLRMTDVARAVPQARRRLQEQSLPFLEAVHAGAPSTLHVEHAEFIAVPLLPPLELQILKNLGKGVDIVQIPSEEVLPAPKEWCPHPESTVCLIVTGNSMSPIILDGYIVAVDTAEVRHDTLVGQIVVAWSAESGLLVSRLIRFDHTDALVSDQRNYETVSISTGSNWRILGKVIWWIGRSATAHAKPPSAKRS